MRDNFFGDIGDFGKYGLLRALSGLVPQRSKRLALGINWYFFPDTGVNYLDDSTLRERDPALFSALYDAMKASRRNVASVGSMGLFDPDTIYFDAPVPARLDQRQVWITEASEKMQRCKLICLDPDSGLTTGNMGSAKISSKHVYCDELMPFIARRQAVVVYHHMPRKSPVEEAALRVRALREELGISRAWALMHTSRLYFVLPGSHESLLRSRLDQFLAGPWGGANKCGFQELVVP